MRKRLVLVMVLVSLLVLGNAVPSLAEVDGVFGPFGFSLDRGFAEYTVTHTGDGSELSVELSFAPGDALAQRGVALKLYGPDGAVVATGDASFGMATITASPDTEGAYVVEVANYHESLPMQFSLVVRGDGVSDVAAVEAVAEEPEVAAPEPVTPEPIVADDEEEPVAPAPEPELELEAVHGPYWFTLDRGFAYSTFEYPGDVSDITIELSYAPGDPLAEAGVVLKLYRPDGTVEATGDKSSGMATIEAAPAAEGTYTIEVANYHESLSLQFWLVIRGNSVSDVSAVEAAQAEATEVEADEAEATEVETNEAEAAQAE